MLRDENDEENYILDWSGADMVEFFFWTFFSQQQVSTAKFRGWRLGDSQKQ